MFFLTLEGKVNVGRRKGRKLGFPTININVPTVIKTSQWGVYFSLIKIGDKFYPGVTHLGPPKTFSLSRATCETHLLTFRQDLYHQAVEKRLIFKFREVEKFPSIGRLKKQMKKDIKAARKFFGL
ncbi:MAG: riboflavin kinase [Patescibacteria group bacterium]|jgi:riboflavin kinase/FMN adenylyltransferase